MTESTAVASSEPGAEPYRVRPVGGGCPVGFCDDEDEFEGYICDRRRLELDEREREGMGKMGTTRKFGLRREREREEEDALLWVLGRMESLRSGDCVTRR